MSDQSVDSRDVYVTHPSSPTLTANCLLIGVQVRVGDLIDRAMHELLGQLSRQCFDQGNFLAELWHCHEGSFAHLLKRLLAERAHLQQSLQINTEYAPAT